MQTTLDKTIIMIMTLVTAVSVFLLLNTWMLSAVYPQYLLFDKRRLIEVGALVISILMLCISHERAKRVALMMRDWPLWCQLLIGITFFWGILSSLLSPHPKYGLLEVALYLGLFLSTCFVATFKHTHSKWFDEAIRATLFTSLAVLCLVDVIIVGEALVGHFQGTLSQSQLKEALIAPFFSNIRFLAQVLIISLPLVVLPLMSAPKGWLVKTLCWVFAVYIWYLALIQQSRAIWISIVVMLVAMLIIYRQRAFGFLWRHGVCFVFGLIGYVVIFHGILHEPWRQLTNILSYDRAETNINALTLIKTHPWFGTGPMQFTASCTTNCGSHPHNFFLLMGSTWGTVAAVLALIVFVFALIRQVRLTKDAPSTISMLLTASLFGIFVDALFSGNTVYPTSQVLIVLVVGWMLGINQVDRADKPLKALDKITIAKMHVLCVLAIVVLLWGIYPDVLHIPGIVQDAINSSSQLHGYFWSQGDINQLVR